MDVPMFCPLTLQETWSSTEPSWPTYSRWILMLVNVILFPYFILLNRKKREDVCIESVLYLNFLTKLQCNWDFKITYAFPFIPMLRKTIILHAIICSCPYITLETRYLGERREQFMQKKFLMLNLRLNKCFHLSCLCVESIGWGMWVIVCLIVNDYSF